MSVASGDADGADDAGSADGASRRTLLRSLGALGVLGAVDAERWTGPWERQFTLLCTPASGRATGAARSRDDAASNRRTLGDGRTPVEGTTLAVETVPTPTAALSALVDGRAAAAELDPLVALLAERAGIGTVAVQASGGARGGGGAQGSDGAQVGGGGRWRDESVIATARDDVAALGDLGGRVVALGDPLCAADALYPLGTLRESVGDDATVRWVDSGSAASTNAGKATGSNAGAATVADASAVGTTARVVADRNDLRTVASAGALPRPVIVAGAALPAVERERFVDAAFAVADDRTGWFGDLRRVDAGALDDVAERAASLGIRLDAL